MPPDFLERPCSVFSSSSPIEAHIVRGMLEDSGIPCALSNEFFANVDRPVADATGGVQVLVRASDADQARELLREAGDADMTVTEEDLAAAAGQAAEE